MVDHPPSRCDSCPTDRRLQGLAGMGTLLVVLLSPILLDGDEIVFPNGKRWNGKVLVNTDDPQECIVFLTKSGSRMKIRRKMLAEVVIDPATVPPELREKLEEQEQRSEFPEPEEILTGEGWESIETENEANRTLPYFFHVPDSLRELPPRKTPVIVSVGGLSGDGIVTPEMKTFARDGGFVILAPRFTWDQKNWEAKRSYQYPAAWSGDAFLRLVTAFEERHRLRAGKFYLFGLSAGAQFVLRFALYKPQRCAAVSGHGSGGSIEPERHLGVAMRMTVGAQDTGRVEQVRAFEKLAKKHRLTYEVKSYEGVGHQVTPEILADTLAFFDRVARIEDRPAHPSGRRRIAVEKIEELGVRTREEFWRLRTDRVEAYRSLGIYPNPYTMDDPTRRRLYGAIDESVGWIEDTQFLILNPYLLVTTANDPFLNSLEIHAPPQVTYEDRAITARYRGKKGREWFARVYDETNTRAGVLCLLCVNAADAGFGFAGIESQSCRNVDPEWDAGNLNRIVDGIHTMAGYFYHRGRKGLNNLSPYCSGARVRLVSEGKATRIVVKLWRNKPADLGLAPDFTYSIVVD